MSMFPSDSMVEAAQKQVADAMLMGGGGLESVPVPTVMIALQGPQAQAIHRMADAVEELVRQNGHRKRGPKEVAAMGGGLLALLTALGTGLGFGIASAVGG